MGDFGKSIFDRVELNDVEFNGGMVLKGSVFDGAQMTNVIFEDNGGTGEFTDLYFAEVVMSTSATLATFTGFRNLDLSGTFFERGYFYDTSFDNFSASNLKMYDFYSEGLAAWQDGYMSGGMLRSLQAKQLSWHTVTFDGVDMNGVELKDSSHVVSGSFTNAKIHNLKFQFGNPKEGLSGPSLKI